jgi:hypothetical protein
METKLDKVTINGVEYIRADAVPGGLPAINTDNIVIVRCRSAGVFFGELVEKDLANNGVVKLKNARRMWYWSGAASLSQLAVDGTSKPKECKWPTAVPEITLTECIEIIPCSAKAIDTFGKVNVWTA